MTRLLGTYTFVFCIAILSACANKAPQTMNSGTAYCGNLLCETGESNATCASDCSPSSTCGNGVCDASENTASCASDCPVISQCGNHICDSMESSLSCPGDCPITTSVCGNNVCESGESTATCANDCPAATVTCTLTLGSGSPVVTTPTSYVNYSVNLSPANSVPAAVPVLSTNPSGAFTSLSTTMPQQGQYTINGNFVTAGTIALTATMTVNSKTVTCQTTTTVTTVVPTVPTVDIYRFDRTSPTPDFLYSVSSAVPAGYAPSWSGATPIPMFKVFSQAPPSSKCVSLPLNQCILNRSPYPVTFLTQAACGAGTNYPLVGQLGYTCKTQVSSTIPLFRMTNNIDFRYYETANPNDIPYLTGQGWTLESGYLGFVPTN